MWTRKINLIICLPLYILFSYMLFKKCPLNKTIRIIVMLPQIISGTLIGLMFMQVVDLYIPELMFKFSGVEMKSFLQNPETAFGTCVFYMIWVSFSTSLIVYPNAMNGVNPEVFEAAELDGIRNMFQELWHIVLPKSYGVISIGFYTGFASLFTNQLSLYAFKGDSARGRIMTLGYYYYVEVQKATDAHNFAKYPFWSAWGLISSAITIPTTFLLRFLVMRIGPSEE